MPTKPRPFFQRPVKFAQYARVTHMADPALAGVVTACTQRGNFYSFEVTWDGLKSSWYPAEELVSADGQAPLGFREHQPASTHDAAITPDAPDAHAGPDAG